MHQEDASRISPPGDTLTGGAATEIAGRRELYIPTIGNGDDRGGIGGVGDVYCPTPEHSCTVYNDHTHCRYVSGGIATHWVAGVLAEVVTREPGPRGEAGSSKGGMNGGDGGECE